MSENEKNPNRIDPLGRPPEVKETAKPGVLANPWVRRTAGVIVGAILGASCPLWPLPIQPICVAVADAVKGLSVGP